MMGQGVRKIFKYGPLEIGVPFVLYMPAEAQIIHFAAQHGQQLWLWAEVDPAREERGRHLMVVATGQEKPHGGTYVESWVSDEYVWHLYDFGGMPPQT